ncbi:hypothetical protein BG011_003213 [Mortierella polycephala]|uniref:Uncharacterized protein n=1 Tax=Mortierella polycephala TaxID=41804 RepID=A0A9P6TUD3_9FUNG|nr:hypothetical protein BG011_003213 [Mortierella polycephala]
MSETVAQTTDEIEHHINRYYSLPGCSSEGVTDPKGPIETERNSDSMDVDDEIIPGRAKRRREDAKSMRIPKAHRTTAQQINDISHSTQNSRRRERRLAKDNDSKAALRGLSRPEHVLDRCQSLAEIEQARSYHRDAGPALKNFERSKARVRDLRNQGLRTKRAWDKLGASERSYVRNHVRQIDMMETQLQAEESEDATGTGNISYIYEHGIIDGYDF